MRIVIQRALVAGLVIGGAWFAALAGCSSGAVCYRNSDCASGYGCRHGACELVSSSNDAFDTGTVDGSGGSGAPGNAGTAGSAGTAGTADAGPGDAATD